eukprot:m51a1_g6696 hypothetical protein (82) ;mRNA; r:83289-83534
MGGGSSRGQAKGDTPGLCPGCGVAVRLGDDGSVGAMGSVWHESCLVCAACGGLLHDSFRAQGTMPFCDTCFRDRITVKCPR